MNIQIFGRDKCFDTKKAERYFKERKTPYQRIDLNKKGLSKGELQSVIKAVGGIRALLDEKSRAYEKQFIPHLAHEEAIFEKLLEYPTILKSPIVRNGREATVGYQPEVWASWN